jgi:predicted RNA-binding Zn ribbon-like protein
VIDPRPLPGEPLALDLLNTCWMSSGVPVDQLASDDGARAWLAAAGSSGGLAWLSAAASSPAATAAVRGPLTQAREAIREALSDKGAAGEQGRTGKAAVERLNTVLSRARVRLSVGADRTPVRELDVADPVWRPAVLAAANLLDLLEAAPDRIRRCQHPACVLWFFDTTRSATRRWCSMATCGNRAKARKHYDRTRSSSAGMTADQPSG